MKKDGIPPAGLTTDEEFLRRIYLDLTGRLPEVEAIRKFLSDKDPTRRERLVDEFMATPTERPVPEAGDSLSRSVDLFFWRPIQNFGGHHE